MVSYMHKFFSLLVSAILSLVLVACGGKGESATPPTNFTATAGDGQVTLTWVDTPGVEYWVFYAPGTLAAGQDILQATGHKSVSKVTSPLILVLPNATAYSFTIDGRTGGGPGGAKASFQYATPRPAGNTWRAATLNTASSNTFRALTFGQDASGAFDFLAVGDMRTLYYKASTAADADNWTQISSATSIVSTANLTAATYSSGRFLVGDSNGNIFYSSDLSTWTATAAHPASINAMASNGTSSVAVGSGGSIWYAADGITWTPINAVPGGGPTLRGVSYLSSGVWVAVGDNGVVWTSSDAQTWSAPSGYTPVSEALYSVAYRPALTVDPVTGATVTYANQYILVGASGRVVTSPDLTTWSSSVINGAGNLTSVTATPSQFLAVDNAGKAFALVDGVSWSGSTSTQAGNLTAVISTMNLGNSINANTLITGVTARYVAVGANGQITYSR